MAVTVNEKNSRVQLKLITGSDDNGNSITKTKSLANVKAGADNEDVMATSLAVVELQKHDLASVTRLNEVELVEE